MIRRTIGAFAASLALCIFVQTASAGDVETLTSKTFDAVIGKEDLVLVKFFAPWCGHCQSMVEDFNKAATKLKGRAVLADVDATVEEELAQKYGVDGFPTIKLFAHGEELVEYKGQRDTASMVRFVESATKPAFEEITTAKKLEKVVEGNKHLAFVFGCGLDDDQKKMLNRASYAIRDLFPDAHGFVHASEPEVVAKYAKLGRGEFALMSFGETVEVAKFDSSEDEDLIKFIKMRSLPTFPEFSEGTAEIFSDMGRPIVVGFFDNVYSNPDEHLSVLRKVAEDMKDDTRLTIAWADATKLASFMEYFGMKKGDIPIAGYNMENDEKYRLPADMEFSEKALKEWVEEFAAGKLIVDSKSEPVPETQPETGAAVVVGDSWESVVEDPKTDVLIAQVAPWCGHCKAMKPSLNRAADELRNAGVKNVLIATMDATENDAPADYKAKGFPTVHFFPAKKGAKGVEFDGERKSADIIEYLKKKAVNKFKFDTSKLGDDPEPPADEEEDAEGEEGDVVDEDAEEEVVEEGEEEKEDL